jgi:hypothetical protein
MCPYCAVKDEAWSYNGKIFHNNKMACAGCSQSYLADIHVISILSFEKLVIK